MHDEDIIEAFELLGNAMYSITRTLESINNVLVIDLMEDIHIANQDLHEALKIANKIPLT